MIVKMCSIYRPMLLSIGLFFASIVSLQSQDFLSLHIKAEFDTIEETVIGEVEHRFIIPETLDTLWLNAVRIEVEELRLNGSEVPFIQNDTALFILVQYNGKEQRLQIAYRAKPRKGLYFIGWKDETFKARRQIWTQGQGIDHRHWIPHRDDQKDKILFSAEWIFKSDYEIMSNGVLDSVVQRDDLRHWYYRMERPMSSYLIALAADRYVVSKKNIMGNPHWLYHYPDRIEDSSWYYHRHREITHFLEKEIAYDYPWSNYKQAPVMDFRHGAMENTCATIFGDFFLVDSVAFKDRNYTYVNAHEYAHQWFGNLVTAAGAKHHWLHEGFATYYQWLSERELYGEEFFQWELQKAREMVFDATAAGPLPLAHPKAGGSRFYQKGGWLLYMLRDYVGDEVYRKVIDEYLRVYAYQVVRNRDLIALFKKHSDKDIEGFFETWLYAEMEPVLDISREEGSDRIQVNLQGRLVQPLVLVSEDSAGGNRVTESIFLEEGLNTIQLKSRNSLFFFSNLPALLVKVNEQKTEEDWRFQIEESTSMLGRSSAFINLRNPVGEEDKALIEASLKNEGLHFSERTSALKSYLENFATDNNAESILSELLLSTADVYFQKEVLKIALESRILISDSILRPIRETGQSYELRQLAIAASLEFLSRASFAGAETYNWLWDKRWEEQPGVVGKEVFLFTLYTRVLLGDLKALESIYSLAGISYDFNTRMEALDYLRSIPSATLSEDLHYEVFFTALFDKNWKLSKLAREYLKGEQLNVPEKFEVAYNKNQDKWTDFQKRRAARIFESK